MPNPYLAVLPTIPTISLSARLARVVRHAALGTAPDWLFTSGKRNRYNPSSVNCLYMSGDQETALGEALSPLAGLPGAGHEPIVVFWAAVEITHVLDLTDARTLQALSLSESDLFAVWSARGPLSKTQQLGLAVARHSSVAAIRYPSVASHNVGRYGLNVAIYPDNLAHPDSVKVIGPGGQVLP